MLDEYFFITFQARDLDFLVPLQFIAPIILETIYDRESNNL